MLGSRPEAIELRIMVRGTVLMPLAELPNEEVLVRKSIDAIAFESDNDQPGQQTIIEAELRCLLVRLWRHCYHAKDTVSSDGPQTILLRRFRQLVEAHFRDRWRISDYANALGTTADRLHNLATKSLGRTPLALVHERSLREAKALLTRSNMSVEQVAAYLGFGTSAQFSAFFRKHESVPPSQFRLEAAASKAHQSKVIETSLMDWP